MDDLVGSLSVSDSTNSTSHPDDIRRVEKAKWSLGNEIGSGSFGVVHVGMNAVDGSEYFACLPRCRYCPLILIFDYLFGCSRSGFMAVKVLTTPSKNKTVTVHELQREIDLMKCLNHPNIVRYLGAEADARSGTLSI